MLVGFDATMCGSRTTGATEYQRHLLAELAGADPAVRLLVYHAKGDRGPAPDGVATREMSWEAADRTRRILLGGLAWRRQWRADRLDVLHVPFYYLPPGAPTRSVVTIYDVRFLRHPETYPRARAAFLRRAVPWSLRRAAHIITISEFSRTELVELLRLDPARISVTRLAPRLGFEPIRDPLTLARVRKTYRLPERFILSTSTLEPRKNLARTVEAFASLRAQGLVQELVLAGVRYFGTGDLDRAITRHGLQSVVHFPGYVADADMAALYSLADVFVYPSLYEGFGLPPLEAMACGTPVVAANATSIPEVVGDAACLVDPESTLAIANGLAQVLENPEYAEALRQRGSLRVAAFTWQRAARETLQVYRRVYQGVA